MTADRIKTNGWRDVTKAGHPSTRKYYELRGSEINKCFGKVQMYNPPNKYHSYVSVRAMISTEDPFVKTIPYMEDFDVIHQVWEELMNQLLKKIFK